MPADSFDVAVTVSKVGQLVDVSYLAANITRRRAQVAELERETSAQAAKLAKTLAAEHVTVRDIGQVLGVSYQRAQQLVAA
ncbi:MAG: hypothetical protein LBC29_01110 [Propionibacteriaceae bacterium]|nr:hypothetical protein [Propionibacteriaceae bacterium]